MRLRLLLPILLFFLNTIIFAQCPPAFEEFHTFNNQAEIDQFIIDYPNCTELENVSIHGNDINDLSGFVNINKVIGLSIYNTLLTNLNGLSNLSEIGDDRGLGRLATFSINLNSQLSDISALGNLTNVADPFQIDVYIQNNPLLISLQGLENFGGKPFYLTIKNNPLITDLTGLSSLEAIETFTIENNDNLVSIDGLESLQGVGEFYIVNNDALIEISDANSLTVGQIIVQNNALLQRIDGFLLNEQVMLAQSAIDIQNNPNLAVCESEFVCYALENNLDYTIQNNSMGCNSFEEVSAECNRPICPTDVNAGSFTSQAQIDQFILDYPDCTELPSLAIGGSDVNNLNGLRNIQGLRGAITISNTTQLTSLDGLHNITEIISDSFIQVYINNNAGLESIAALKNMQFSDPNSTSDIFIENNPVLQSLDGLQGFSGYFFQIYIVNNDSLTNLYGLENYAYSEDLRIYDNENLTSLEGLNNLDFILYLELKNNQSLVDLTTNVPIDIGYLTVENNPVLDNLGNFKFAQEVAEFNYDPGFIIRNNPNLSVCGTEFVCFALENYTGESPVAEYNIAENNAPGCNSITEIDAACNPPICPTDVNAGNFTSQAQIDQFIIDYPNCTELPYLSISGNDINNLDGLANIESIQSNIRIINNPMLTNLAGLVSLKGFGNDLSSIEIVNNDMLQNIITLSGLSNLSTFQIVIQNNPSLLSLDGLQGISGAGDKLDISNNAALSSLDGLININSLLDDATIIRDNPSLTSLTGLDNITRIDEFNFINNDKVSNFQALNNVELRGSLVVQGNTILEDIDGFYHPLGYPTGVIITDNPLLSVCSTSYVCDAIEDNSTLEISNNASGCASAEEVITACNPPICPTDPLAGIFSSQAEIDQFLVDFPNCTELEYLNIEGQDITNLSGLKNIETVRSNIYINWNPNLTSLSGLEKLSSFGTSMESGDTAILFIRYNPVLNDVSSLANLSYPSDVLLEFAFYENVLIEDLTDFSWISGHIDNLAIFGNSNLISLNGLENISSVANNLRLFDNPILSDISALDNIGSARILNFENNDALVDLSVLDGLSSCNVRIVGNQLLSILPEINMNLDCTDQSIEFTDNPKLEICNKNFVCESIEAMPTNDFINVILRNNSIGCNSVSEVESICNPPICPTSYIEFTSQAQIDQFIIDYPNCTVLPSLRVKGEDITNLEGFKNIETILRDFSIRDNPNLTSLNGLNNLKEFATEYGNSDLLVFAIDNNPSLTDIDPISNLSVAGTHDFWIVIQANTSLKNIDGLINLSSYANYALITNNASLQNINGLEKLVNPTEFLAIVNNPNLESLSGLQNVATLENFSLINCPKVTDLSPLQDIPLNGSLRIEGNTVLNEIDAFSMPTSVSDDIDITIKDNPSLGFCNTDFLCEFIEIAATTDIVNNAVGCNSLEEIELICNPPNPNCADATVLDLGKNLNYRGEFSNQDFNLPLCTESTSNSINDVWFTFNSGSDSFFTLNVSRGYHMQLWTGACNALEAVPNACEKTRLSNISLNPNTDYYIQVWDENAETRRVSEIEFEIVVESESTLSLKDDQLQDIKLIPNPVESRLNLIIPSQIQIESIAIYTIQGKLVETTDKKEINMKQYPTGVYFVKITSDQNRSITKKIVKL